MRVWKFNRLSLTRWIVVSQGPIWALHSIDGTEGTEREANRLLVPNATSSSVSYNGAARKISR